VHFLKDKNMTRFQKEEEYLYFLYCAVAKALGYNVRIIYPYFEALKNMNE
jgi:hypothetical protein